MADPGKAKRATEPSDFVVMTFKLFICFLFLCLFVCMCGRVCVNLGVTEELQGGGGRGKGCEDNFLRSTCGRYLQQKLGPTSPLKLSLLMDDSGLRQRCLYGENLNLP